MKKGKSIWIKLLIGLVVCLGALILISAGGRDSGGSGAVPGSAANVNPPGVFPIAKEQITMHLAIRQRPQVENYETNAYTRRLEEMGNMSFNIELYPSQAPGNERMLIQIASGGPLPEVLIDFGFSGEQLLNMGQEGVALPLNYYYDNWAYHIPQQMEKVTIPNIWRLLESADGNIYYIPHIQEQIGETYSLRGWMNEKWLDNLGLRMPTTTTEFRTVLETFRDRNPTGTARRDIVPSGGNTDQRGRLHDFLINAFIYNDNRDRLLVTNGIVDVIYNKPEYREALIYIRDLMRDGLILDQLFTINAAGFRGIVESHQTEATVGFFTAGFAGALSPNNELRLEYVPMAPLMGPQGVQYTPYMPMGPMSRYIITTHARNPEAAFRLGDYMCSEEMSIWVRFGRPEIDWRLPRPGEMSMYHDVGMPARLAEILPWGAVQNSHWVQGAAAILYMGIMDGQVASDNPLNNEIWISRAAPLYMNLAPPPERRVDFTTYTFDEMQRLGDLRTTINGYVSESMALFIMDHRNIEREWDGYVQELNRMGLQRYLEIVQVGYERAIGRR